jgi:cytochrome c oxidase cbb3-type subunit 3
MRRSPVATWTSARIWTVATFVGLILTPSPGGAQVEASSDEEDLARGRLHYIASCARCHGVEGGGGEGPPLARSTLTRAPDDRALMRIMARGIPGTGMSGARWLAPSELRQVALYVRSLAPAGPDDAEVLSGNPSQGRALFDSEGCARCHTVGGFGTARGPDLTTVGARRGASHLREALLDPGASLPRGLTAMPRDFVDYLVVRVVDSDGEQHRGMRMNEDTYSIQIKDARGVVRSFYKPDLLELRREFDRSLMQSYRDRLTEEQIDDIVAYLATLTGQAVRGIS